MPAAQHRHRLLLDSLALPCLQQLEAEQAEQKRQFSSAMADVNGHSLQLQQEVAAARQQLQQEQAKAQHLGSSLASVQQKFVLLKDPAAAATARVK